jgi:hypothetical protein
MFAHAAFDQKHDKQGNYGGYDNDDSPAKALAAPQL